MKHIVTLTTSNPGHEHIAFRRKQSTTNFMVEAANEEEAINRAYAHFRRLGHYIHEAKILKKKDENLNESAAVARSIITKIARSAADDVAKAAAKPKPKITPTPETTPVPVTPSKPTQKPSDVPGIEPGPAVIPFTPKGPPAKPTPTEKPAAPVPAKPVEPVKPAPAKPAPVPVKPVEPVKPAPAKPVQPAPVPVPPITPVKVPVAPPAPITLPDVPPAVVIPRPTPEPATVVKPGVAPQVASPIVATPPVVAPVPGTATKPPGAGPTKPTNPKLPRPFFLPRANRGETDIGTLGQYRGMFPLYQWSDFSGQLQENKSILNSIGRVMTKRKKISQENAKDEKNKINMEPKLRGKV